jgi:hypothetical protein
VSGLMSSLPRKAFETVEMFTPVRDAMSLSRAMRDPESVAKKFRNFKIHSAFYFENFLDTGICVCYEIRVSGLFTFSLGGGGEPHRAEKPKEEES